MSIFIFPISSPGNSISNWMKRSLEKLIPSVYFITSMNAMSLPKWDPSVLRPYLYTDFSGHLESLSSMITCFLHKACLYNRFNFYYCPTSHSHHVFHPEAREDLQPGESPRPHPRLDGTFPNGISVHAKAQGM